MDDEKRRRKKKTKTTAAKYNGQTYWVAVINLQINENGRDNNELNSSSLTNVWFISSIYAVKYPI